MRLTIAYVNIIARAIVCSTDLMPWALLHKTDGELPRAVDYRQEHQNMAKIVRAKESI